MFLPAAKPAGQWITFSPFLEGRVKTVTPNFCQNINWLVKIAIGGVLDDIWGPTSWSPRSLEVTSNLSGLPGSVWRTLWPWTSMKYHSYNPIARKSHWPLQCIALLLVSSPPCLQFRYTVSLPCQKKQPKVTHLVNDKTNWWKRALGAPCVVQSISKVSLGKLKKCGCKRLSCSLDQWFSVQGRNTAIVFVLVFCTSRVGKFDLIGSMNSEIKNSLLEWDSWLSVEQWNQSVLSCCCF